MNTCAECRFWKDDDLRKRFYGQLPLSNQPGEWKECTRVYEDDARLSVAAIYAEDDAAMTRSGFGCVQFEPKPMPENMSVIYASSGERIEPLPGHVFTAPDWSGNTKAMKVSIDDQWFEIRPR